MTIHVPVWFSQEFKRLTTDEKAPLCACGCGKRVRYSYGLKRWPKYANGHSQITAESNRRLRELYDVLPYKITQKELRDMLGLDSSDTSRVVMGMMELGLVKREKTFHNRRWTFLITKIPKPVNKPTEAEPPKQVVDFLERARRHYNKIVRTGFILKSELSALERNAIMRGEFGEVPTVVRIGGVQGAHGKKFSTYDFFGERMDVSYLVLDMEGFKTYISRELEGKFLMWNPNPSRSLRWAFSSYMHDHGLHWSGCIDNKND
jgi:hypothetical protein